MIYDITQPLFECHVFPGDERPKKKMVRKMEDGEMYNLTEMELCVHNGTHVDAPMHFIKDGKGIDEVDITKFIGASFVADHEGDVTKDDAKKIVSCARKAHKDAYKKILIKGKSTVTLEAAKVFKDEGVELIGNESQTVGPEDAPMEVHLVLLGAEVVLLEGVRLDKVKEGAYFLNCVPLKLSKTDGSPCRAYLMDLEDLNNY